MRTRKPVIFVLISLFFILPGFAKFIDVPKGHKSAPAIQKLLDFGIIKLSQEGKFKGKTPVTMYQMTVIMDEILDKSGKRKALEAVPIEDFYVNVPEKHYAYRAVRDMVKMGLFVVPDSKVFPGEIKVNRATFYSYMAAFLERLEGKALAKAAANKGYSDLSKGHAAYPYVQKLIGAGLLGGKGKFNENMLVSRYEMASFIDKIVDYYLKLKVAGRVGDQSGYIDILKSNYAFNSINELIEIGVLKPRDGEKFFGKTLINRYFLADLTLRILEKVVLQEDVKPAPFARSYKDVPTSHFAYKSIQKLITLGVIPPGNRAELFYGERKISRYQMAYFAFSAVEYVLRDTLIFQPAHSSLGYYDVPTDYFVFDTIQKLVWLDVLEGGLKNKYNGNEYIDRYELCSFSVELIEAVFEKIEELKEEVYKKPEGFGFETYLNTQLNFSQVSGVTEASAYQQADIMVDREIRKDLSAFISFSSRYNFGDTTTLSSPFLEQAYLLFEEGPFVAQVGRADYYQGYTPFGNSIYVDTNSIDQVLANYDHHLFNLNAIAGKFVYFGDISLDSNFGTIAFSPKLPPTLSWLELSLGTSIVTDLPDPTFSYTLPTRVVQGYGGLRINLLNVFEFTAETANLTFSDPSVFSIIGTSANKDTTATQYSLSYYSEDFGYVVSLGYQAIGDDYFLSVFNDPTSIPGTARNTESWLFRTRHYPSSAQMIGADLSYVSTDGYNNKTGLSGYYNFEVLEDAYLNFELSKIMDNLSAQDEIRASCSFSLSF
ncbi:MAG: S-layer homology domain-containing protein [Candidatus Margulisiibacteriota bacterium]|nr:S-layer homology domain-containing protein [Candidatus Margulisiibacteriota bacterium]